MGGQFLHEDVSELCRQLEAQYPQYSYDYDAGPVYLKIWRRLGTQDSRSVVYFVRKSDGEVKRADSWKKAGRSLGSLQEFLEGRR